MQSLSLAMQRLRNGGFEATICLYFAVVLSAAQPYIVKEHLHSFAIAGSVVEIDCISNSSGQVHWWSAPFGTQHKYRIARGNKTRSEQYRIKTTRMGQAALIIEWVKMSSAGMYVCHDFEGDLVQAELTVLDPNPQCNELPRASSSNILCNFQCAGNRCLELELTETASWNMRCSSLIDSVECEFGGRCNWTIPYAQQSNVSILCGVDGNSKCEWDVNHERIYINGTNKSIGGWRCSVETTSTIETPILPDGATVCLPVSALAVLLFVLVLVILIIFLLTVMYIRQKRKLDSSTKSRTPVPRYDYIDLQETSPQNNEKLSTVYANDQSLTSNARSTANYHEAISEIAVETPELSAHAQAGGQAKGLDPFYEKLQDRPSPSATQTYVGLTISTSLQ